MAMHISMHVSERMRGLRTAYQEVEKALDARGAASEQGRVLSSKEKVREFLLESIEKEDGVETSCKLRPQSVLAQVSIVPECHCLAVS